MAFRTKIQWCHSTNNPIMGCGGCELYPSPAELAKAINDALAKLGIRIDSRKLLRRLIREHYDRIPNPHRGHRNAVTTTNIHHLRFELVNVICRAHGALAGKVALDAIQDAIKCYAAKLHLNKATSIVNFGRSAHKGYAPEFEQVTQFPGRMAEVAGWKDLLGLNDSERPWLDGLPRLIFTSDMGDAFSSKGQFGFLKREVAAISSEKGKRHLWLWLTKRPHHMREFSEEIGGFPDNVCAMTTVTSRDSLHRVDELRAVKASSRGLSIEPLWERLPAEELDLTGIDWVIVGGESGSGKSTRSFDVAWAEELRQHCRENGVAFFLKQLGRNPVIDGKVIKLKDAHGGDWDEWPKQLRVREFPRYLHQYRSMSATVAV